jgi:predicted DCC family thiol-disulfide oxidoreductase YuxK
MGGAEFLYDGDCGFCSACARFIDRRIPTTARVVAWQRADLAELGLTAEECDQAVQWVSADRRVITSGPAAIASLLQSSSAGGGRGSSAAGWRLLGRLLALPPALALAWPVYRWVSRHRDRMPGGTPTCALPAAERTSDRVGERTADQPAAKPPAADSSRSLPRASAGITLSDDHANG